MTKRIELPEGQWVEVKDVAELRRGDRKAVNAAVSIRIDPETKEQILPGDFNDRMHDVLLARIIENWSFDLGLPKFKPGSLDELTNEQMAVLYDGVEEYVKALNISAKQEESPTN